MRHRVFGSMLGGLLLVGSALAWGQSVPCRQVKATPYNAAAPITVSTTAVTVMTANTSRCSVAIQNTSTNIIMCRDVDKDGVPTGLLGTPIAGGNSLILGPEGQGRWQCIRASVATADGVVSVAEGLP